MDMQIMDMGILGCDRERRRVDLFFGGSADAWGPAFGMDTDWKDDSKASLRKTLKG